MKSTFSTIFYLKRLAVKKDGTVPIMGRITVDGTQMEKPRDFDPFGHAGFAHLWLQYD